MEFLSPAEAVFDAMLAGWGTQQRSRSLSPVTIEKREYTVRRFAGFTNEFPWSWSPADVGGVDVVDGSTGSGACHDPG